MSKLKNIIHIYEQENNFKDSFCNGFLALSSNDLMKINFFEQYKASPDVMLVTTDENGKVDSSSLVHFIDREFKHDQLNNLSKESTEYATRLKKVAITMSKKDWKKLRDFLNEADLD